MAAADQAEGDGGVDEAAAVTHSGGGAAGVHHVDGILVLVGDSAGADDAVLALEGDVHPFRQIVGDQGGQADTQVDHVAVLQLLGHTGGDERFDLRLFH